MATCPPSASLYIPSMPSLPLVGNGGSASLRNGDPESHWRSSVPSSEICLAVIEANWDRHSSLPENSAANSFSSALSPAPPMAEIRNPFQPLRYRRTWEDPRNRWPYPRFYSSSTVNFSL